MLRRSRWSCRMIPAFASAMICLNVAVATAGSEGVPRLVGPDGFIVPPAVEMVGDDKPVPLEACTRPGRIKVTLRALGSAQPFASALPAGWIAAFGWYDGQRMRASKDAPWVETGPGVDVGAYKASQIPVEAIYREGPFPYAVLIRKEIVEAHPDRTIDLDAGNHMVSDKAARRPCLA